MCDLGPDLVQAFMAVRVAEQAHDPTGVKAMTDWAFCY